MFSRNPPLAALCLGTALTLAGCGKKKQTPIPTPPAPLPARQPAAAPPQQSPAQPQPSATQAQPFPAQPQPPATQPPPTRHRRRPSPMPVQSAPAPVEPPQPAPAAPPVLGTMLTPERKLALNQEIDRSLARARSNLSSLAGKNVDAAGRETARQVQSFIHQAQTARASDLEASRSLAERADLLSRDLLRETGQ